jgi:hypothetical protein
LFSIDKFSSEIVSTSCFSKFQISTAYPLQTMREKLKKKLQLINFSYLTILKFSFGIVFSISFLGAGKSTCL